jgi:hypothetical protein
MQRLLKRCFERSPQSHRCSGLIEERNWGEIARSDEMKIALWLRLGKVRGLREDVAIHGLEV